MVRSRFIFLLAAVASALPSCRLFGEYPELAGGDDISTADLGSTTPADGTDDVDGMELDEGFEMSCVERMLRDEGASPVEFQQLLNVKELSPGRVRALSPSETRFEDFDSGAVSAQGLEPRRPGSAFFFLIEVAGGQPHHYFGLYEPERSPFSWSFAFKYMLDEAEAIFTPSLARPKAGLDDAVFERIEAGDVLKIERGTERLFADLYSRSDCAWRGARQFDAAPDAEATYRAALRYSDYYARQRQARDPSTGLEPQIEGAPLISTTILFSCPDCER